MEYELLKIVDVTKILRMSRSKLYRQIKKEQLLKQIKIGGSSFWCKKNIYNYIDRCKNN